MKGDVYSFGVVLLELLTGKRPTDEAFVEEGTRLVTWVSIHVMALSIIYEDIDSLSLQVKTVVQGNKEEHVVDRSLEDFPAEEINSMFNVALMCLESDPSIRPSMAEVVNMLEQIKQ